MAISLEKFDYLEAKYGGFASWAIWDPDDPRDASVIRQNLSDLNPEIVMVGLNVSAPLPYPWANFRIGRNDRKLIHAFNNSEFRGAYMTDIVKGEVEVRSDNIKKRIKNGELDIQKHIEAFETEMNDIGANDRSLFILFGGLVDEIFRKYLSPRFPRSVACQHYAVYGSSESWAVHNLKLVREWCNN